jgi:hypothetical protein
MKKVLALIAAVCVSTVMIAGCYGPFKLTRKVYEWNGSLESKWGREAMFLVLSVLPVYGFSLLADAVFFNLIDFWEGESPLASQAGKRSRMVSMGDRTAVMTYSAAQRRMRVDLFNHYRPERSFIIESPRDGMAVAKDLSGKTVMTAKALEDGSVFVQDPQGREVACHIPEEAQ